MNFNIVCIPGDGIGPEVTSWAVRVFEAVCEKFGHTAKIEYIDAGGVAIDKYGTAIRPEDLEKAKNSDGVLLGAVGGPKWDNCPTVRPEQALFALRGGLELFANYRPAVLFPQLKDSCPLKDEIIKDGLDVMVVRELTGGIYFGKKGLSDDGDTAYDVEIYSKYEIERILRAAAETAKLRSNKVTVVDKANVLESSRLWRRVAAEVFRDYPEISVNYMYVDNAAMQLVRNPSQFDVIVTSNLFGDILTDEASMITGSIGMLPSASMGSGKTGMFEPIHGSAPDIAGKGIANPIASILSAAMMFKYSFGLDKESDLINNAVKKALDNSFRTADIAKNGEKVCSTDEMGKAVLENI